ncbi:properdin-like [Pimephales promelas]|uniref:properdin-like n=1 Tax=Pimephales promelas TaxID=90988 RepID=UPI001955AAC1|nr:properdin-like [Pimephales promelas]KAG1933061.1 complement factor properdin [Pimephales promelas]KAG1933062.1 complement factor properdin [Pimephales promelas]
MNLILWVIVLLGTYPQQSVSQISCYSSFLVSTGKCDGLLGQVEKDLCCLNPNYGYTEADGVCRSCGPATWTLWSSWGECSVSCTEGVRQRRRSCSGNGDCSDPKNLGTVQTEPCVKKNCCPVEGGWSEWGKWQPCSVTCEKGLKSRQRTCSNPSPQCGGSCSGEEKEIVSCDTEIICPTHGGWSSWGGWGPCPATCIVEGHNTQKERRTRTCTNPSPSMLPRGRDCEGSNTDTRPCSGLPFCPIDGNWGSWSGSTPCSVTCGVGLQTQRRLCDSPKPTHGGRQCRGEELKNGLCTIPVPCPIDGMWTEWSEWGQCKSPSTRNINCRNRDGTRRRERVCDGRKYEGNFCDGEIIQHGSCYDIDGCIMTGVLSEWSQWTYCKPDCGPDSVQTREKKCVPDISEYRVKDLNIFSGKPKLNCAGLENQTQRKPCKNVPECKDKGD